MMSGEIQELSNISDFYHGGVIEVGVFTAEYIAERIADEVSVTNHHVGGMMGMAVNPCFDSTVSYVISKFSGICSIQYVTCVSLFEC